MKTKALTIYCPLGCFPSDNKIDGGGLKERLQLKQNVKDLSDGIILEALQKQGIKRWHLTKERPLFKTVGIRFTLILKTKRRRDLPNFSEKQFIDKLVEKHIFKDDSVEFLRELNKSFGGYGDRDEVVIQVLELEDDEEPTLKAA